MQQRVSIAATLILEPRILLMDEPFGALDPRIRLRMQELLIQLWREQQGTVFLVTHSVEEAVYLGRPRLCDGRQAGAAGRGPQGAASRTDRRRRRAASLGSSTSRRNSCAGWRKTSRQRPTKPS